MSSAHSRPKEKTSPVEIPVPKHTYRWVILGICWFAYVVIFMQRFSIGPLAPFLKEDLNLSSTQVGLFVSAVGVGFAIVALPAGWLVDRVGIRWLLSIGELFGGIFIVSLYTMTGFVQGLILMSLAGLGMGCIMPASTKAILEWFPTKERATAMGFKQTGVNIGGIVAASTLPTLALAVGWRYGFLGTGLLAIVFAVATFVLYRDPPVTISRATAGPSMPASSRASLRATFQDRDIWLIMLASMCLNAVEFASIAYFVLYLQDILFFSVVTAGFLLALLNGSGAFGKPLSGLASDLIFRGGRKNVMMLMAAIMLLCCAALAFLRTGAATWLVVTLAIALGFTAVGWAGLSLTLVSEFAGKEQAGIAIGANSVFLMVASIIATPFFGYILDTTGSYTLAWLFLAGLSLLAVLLLIFVREERRKL